MRKFYAKLLSYGLFFISFLILTNHSKAQQSLYNGQIPISVPLHTVDNGRVQVPIRLDYDGSGVKPNQHPGWAGLNWNLSAGGAVVREVKGIPDDFYHWISVLGPDNIPVVHSEIYGRAVASLLGDLPYPYSITQMESANDAKMPILLGQSGQQTNDLENDVFRFILPNGISGEFYLKSMNPETWILKGNKKYKVELIRNATGPSTPNNLLTYLMTCPLKGIGNDRLQVMDKTTTEKKMMPNIVRNDVIQGENYANSFCFIGFKITTDDGTVYTFGGTDPKNIQFSKPFFQQHSSHWQADAWYLVKIVSSDGEEITLTYDDELTSDVVAANPNATKYINNMVLSRNDTKFYDCSNRGDCGSAERPDVILDPNKDGVYSGILIKPTYLKQIDSKTETINFVRTPSIELEYDYRVYEKYFDFFIQNMTFASYTISGGSQNDYKFTWCPYLKNGIPSNYPNLGGLTKEQYIKQNWTNNLTFYKLSSVQVLSKKDANTEVLKYTLNYNNDTKSYPGSHNETERLILQSVSKIANNKKISYSFDYDIRISLPNKYLDPNGLVDHWGYFNNKVFNIETENTDVRYWSDYYFSREATVDAPTALAGSLKSIKLPTGGKINYIFEQNKHTIGYGFSSNSPDASGNRISGGLRIASVENEDEVGSVIGKVNYKYVYDFKQIGSGSTSSGQRDARIDYYILFKNTNGTNYIYENQHYNRKEAFNSRGRVLLAGSTLSTPPVNYSEVTIENTDKSYSILKFSNFFNKDGTSWIQDEDVPPNQRLQNRVTAIDLNPQEPIISRAFERGLILFEENYGSNDLIVSKKEYTYGDITPRSSEFTFSVDTRTYPGKTDSQTNWGAVVTKAIITSIIPYASAVDFVFTALGIDWGPSTSTVQIRSTNFGYVYKVYTNLYGLKSDKTTIYDLKDASRITSTTTINDYNYNQYNTIGQLNEVITTLPIDNYENNKYKQVQLINRTKFASDYGSSNKICNDYAGIVYQNCLDNPGKPDKNVCVQERNNALTSCLGNLSTSVSSIEQLKSKNMLSYPIENTNLRKTTSLNGTPPTSIIINTLSGNLNFYKTFAINSQLVPMLDESYSLANDNSLTDVTLSEIQLSSGNKPELKYSNRYTIKNLKVENYDSKGNPNKITSRSGITQNITYDTYNYPLTQSIDNTPVVGGSGVGSSSFAFSHLRGLTSSTDDNGKIISYTYDGFNRLKTVADNEGNILRSYAYNLPYSNPLDGTKADLASTTEKAINSFSQIDECKPEKSYCDIQSKIKPFDSASNCINGQIKLEFDPENTTTGTDVTYEWKGPNNFKSTVASPIINTDLLKASGTYTLSVTRNQCKGTATATVEILIDCNCSYTINTNGTTTNNLTCGTDIGATIKLMANCSGCSGEIISGQETFVNNGKFDNGNINFSADYDKYIVTNPNSLGSPFRSFGDHTSGSGNMVVAGHSDTPNLRLYYITITNLKPKTRYQVSGWLAGATDNNPNIMFFEMDGIRLTEEIGFSTSQGGIWKQLKSIWTTGENQTSVTLAIRKRGTVGWNWICLDDISLTEAPQPQFYWTGPNNYSSILQNPVIRNATAKNAGTYILSVLDKNCVRTQKININCPVCTQPITLIAGSNTPVSSGGTIKLNASVDAGATITWFGTNITSVNQNLPKPEIPINWIVKDGGETVRYTVQAYKNGCADSSYTDISIIKNTIPPGKSGADLALRIRREDGLTTMEAGETARFCVDVNNAGPSNAYDVTFRVVIPPCLDLVDLNSNGTAGSVSGPENNYSIKQQAWYNTTTRELSNMCSANPNQTPPFRNVGDCWQFRGAEMGGDWSWNNWNKPSAADLMNFSPHTFTKSMCFNLKASQKAKFIFKGEVMSSRGGGYDDIIDPDSFTADGVDNGEDDRAELTLNESYDILTVSQERFALGNKNVSPQTFNVSTLRSGWTISILGSNTSWITITPTIGTGSNGTLKTTSVQFTIADNPSAFSRYLTIVVKSACGDEKRVNVKQAGSIECPSGLIATASTPVVCGNTIQLGASIKAIQDVNLIDNGSFENGNTGFSSEAWNYYNGTSGNRAYVVSENPQSIMWFTRASCPGTGDINSGSGKMMGVSGSFVGNGFFWSQTVNIDKGTDYDLSLKAVQLGNYDNSGIILEYFVNGTPTGVKGSISTIGCTWGKISGKWYSGEFFGSITLSLKLINPSNGEKMFAIDDLSMNLSKNGRVSDEATASYSWKGPDADPTRLKPASGFTSSIQNPTITGAAYKNDGIYTVTATRSGCSVTSQVAVNVDCPTNVCVAPTVTTSPSNGVLCANLNQSVILTVTGCTGTIFWTDSPTGISDNPRTVTLITKGTYTYKARCVTNCGMSPDSPPAMVIVRGIPSAPTLSTNGPVKICPTNNFNVSATGCSTGTIRWTSTYPGSAVVMGANYNLIDGTNISVTNPVTLSVTCVDACGTSIATTLGATVENFLSSVIPVASINKTRLCKGGGTVSLSATGCPDNTNYKWYSSTNVYLGNTNPLAITTTVSASYKVRCEQQACQSPFSSPVSVDVRTDNPPAPSTPTLASGQSSTICAGTTITIYSTGCSEANNTLVWSTGQVSVSSISWSNSLSGTYNISVKCKSDIGCESTNSGELAITIPPGPPAPTNPCLSQDPGCTYATICTGGYTVIYGGSCGTGQTSIWYSSTDNSTFTELSGFTTGNITVAPMQTTYYKVACKNSCSTGAFAAKTVLVTVVSKPAKAVIVDPAVDMVSTYPSCTSVSIYSNKSACEAAGYSLKWYKNDIEISGATSWNYNATASGTYKVRCVNNNNPTDCREGDVSNGRVIYIENSPPTPTLSSATNTCGSKVLTSSSCGAGLTYKWYNVDTEISGATGQNYTATASSTYSVKCVNNSNTFCKESGRNDGVPVTIRSGTVAPTISSNVTSVCANTLPTLTATGCEGGTITWSNGSTGTVIRPTVTTSTTFSATCNDGTCISGSSNGVTVNITTTGCPGSICSSSVGAGNGGNAGFNVTFAPLQTTGSLTFNFDPQTVPDQLIVGKSTASNPTIINVINTGCVGGTGVVTSSANFVAGDIITVQVVPNCNGTTGTAWSFTSSCGPTIIYGQQSRAATETIYNSSYILVKDFFNKILFELPIINSIELNLEKILKEKGLENGTYKVEIFQNGIKEMKMVVLQYGAKITGSK